MSLAVADLRYDVVAIIGRAPRFHEKRQRGDGASDAVRAGVLRVRIAQTIDQAREFAMKLQIALNRERC